MHDMSFHDDHVRVQRTLAIKTNVPNVCIARPKMPETVYIVAGGPNGATPALTISEGATVIACNSAILMPRPFQYWVAFDHRICNYGWWNQLSAPRIDCIHKLFSARLLNRLSMPPAVRNIKADYYFEYLPEITWPHGNNPKGVKMPRAQFLDPTRLRGGCTVSGVALQFAHYGGARNIVLCGVDMAGTGHWDGFTNPDPWKLCAGVWPWAEPMQILCEEITKRGSTVWTMSRTALELPIWK